MNETTTTTTTTVAPATKLVADAKKKMEKKEKKQRKEVSTWNVSSVCYSFTSPCFLSSIKLLPFTPSSPWRWYWSRGSRRRLRGRRPSSPPRGRPRRRPRRLRPWRRPVTSRCDDHRCLYRIIALILSPTLQLIPILVFTTNQNYPTGWRVCWRDCRDLKRNQPDSQTILKWRNWFGTKPGKRNRLETRNWSQRTKPGIDLLIFWPGSRNRLHTAPNGRRGNKN